MRDERISELAALRERSVGQRCGGGGLTRIQSLKALAGIEPTPVASSESGSDGGGYDDEVLANFSASLFEGGSGSRKKDSGRSVGTDGAPVGLQLKGEVGSKLMELMSRFGKGKNQPPPEKDSSFDSSIDLEAIVRDKMAE